MGVRSREPGPGVHTGKSASESVTGSLEVAVALPDVGRVVTGAGAISGPDLSAALGRASVLGTLRPGWPDYAYHARRVETSAQNGCRASEPDLPGLTGRKAGPTWLGFPLTGW